MFRGGGGGGVGLSWNRPPKKWHNVLGILESAEPECSDLQVEILKLIIIIRTMIIVIVIRIIANHS